MSDDLQSKQCTRKTSCRSLVHDLATEVLNRRAFVPLRDSGMDRVRNVRNVTDLETGVTLILMTPMITL